MPGPKPQYPITLFDNEIDALRQLVSARKTPQGQARRARIILAAYEHPQWSNQEIARAVGCTDRSVRTWRRRWTQSKSLADRPRPGAPRRFSPHGAG